MKRNLNKEISVEYLVNPETKLSETENNRVRILLQKSLSSDICEKYDSFQEVFFILIGKTNCSEEIAEKLNKKFSKEITNIHIEKEKNKFKKSTLMKAYQTMNTYHKVVYNILDKLDFKGELVFDPFEEKKEKNAN